MSIVLSSVGLLFGVAGLAIGIWALVRTYGIETACVKGEKKVKKSFKKVDDGFTTVDTTFEQVNTAITAGFAAVQEQAQVFASALNITLPPATQNHSVALQSVTQSIGSMTSSTSGSTDSESKTEGSTHHSQHRSRHED